MPEYWPWEEAKKVFQEPDVVPADEVEVRLRFCLTTMMARDHGTI